MLEERRIQDNYAQGSGAPKPTPPQVASACGAIEEGAAVAHKLLDELEQRLSPVLRNEPVAASGATLKEQQTVVALAGRLNDAGQQVVGLCDRIKSISRRLEI